MFHGVALPPRSWAAQFDGDLVLQPYHPILAGGGYREWFPCARRWVYHNPTAVDESRAEGIDSALLEHHPDDRWDLPRLRLPDALHVALDDAEALASVDGVDGLFVDDLDWMLLTADAVVPTYLEGLRARVSCPVFVNRAFRVLDAVPRVEAVLVEGLEWDLGSPAAVSWVKREAVPQLTSAAASGARLHSLEYLGRSTRLSREALRVQRRVAGLCSSTHRAVHERLDEWGEWT